MKHTLLNCSFAIIALLFTSVASATLITGQSGLINVVEEYYQDFDFSGTDGIQYSLDILNENSAVNVTAFAVSNSTIVPYTDVLTTRSGWVARQVSSSVWDSGFIINSFHNDILTTELGLFSDFFGDDLYANIFMMPAANTNTAITTLDDEQFQFKQQFGLGFSDFVAFEYDVIVDQSRATSNGTPPTDVPEPSTLAIFALGMMGLVSRRFKR